MAVLRERPYLQFNYLVDLGTGTPVLVTRHEALSDFARAFTNADRVLLPAVFRSQLPDDQRLSVEQLITDLRTSGQDARFIPQVDDIVSTVANEARAGDLVVVMSNGGFDNIHQKLLTELKGRSRD